MQQPSAVWLGDDEGRKLSMGSAANFPRGAAPSKVAASAHCRSDQQKNAHHFPLLSSHCCLVELVEFAEVRSRLLAVKEMAAQIKDTTPTEDASASTPLEHAYHGFPLRMHAGSLK